MDIASIKDTSKTKGFTLLELLIVIAIIAILSVILIIVINPAETLAKSRDAQRLSDLNTVKTALGIYITSTTSPDLDAAFTASCLTNPAGTVSTAALISYSAEIADAVCLVNIVEGADVATGGLFAFTGGTATDFCRYVGTTGASVVDGTGWVSVDLTGITGGSPLSNYPLDPTNDITVGGSTSTVPTSTALVYRYACQNKSTTAGKPSFVFELDAQLESTAFTVTDDKRAKDGGDNANYLEVGNSVKLMGTGTNYQLNGQSSILVNLLAQQLDSYRAKRRSR